MEFSNQEIRRMTLIEVAEKYHLDIARKMRHMATHLRKQGLHCAAEEDITTAMRHEQYAKDIKNEIWKKQ